MTIEFYWDDLTPRKQTELLELLGNNHNWDMFPFCTLKMEEEED